jgi:Tol biopolymer transport system component
MNWLLLKLFLAGIVLPLGLARAENEKLVSSGDERFLSNIRQLTFEGRRSGEGYFSPDGTKLIFQSERQPGNPFYQIYLLDLETGETRRVSPGNGKTTCAFFRPGTDQVLFASTHHDPAFEAKQQAEFEERASGQTRRYAWDYDEQFDIFVANRDGSNLRQLTDAWGYDAEAAFSPDGRQIVFTSMRRAYPEENLSPSERRRLKLHPSFFGEIYIMNADGSDQRRLTFNPGYDGGPFFSPDGERIVWRRFDPEGKTADIFTMNRDGSDQRRLTDFSSISWAPYYHPSGQYIIFSANREGFTFELFIVDTNGAREPVQVTATESFDGLPVFAPDGRRLAWTSNRSSNGTSQIFLADWDHEAALEELELAPRRQTQIQGGTPSSFGIHRDNLRRHVEYLASDALEGRMAGSPGAEKAALYLAGRLKESGVRPFDPDGTFFQEYTFTAGVQVASEGNSLFIEGNGETSAFEVEKDFRPLSFTANGEVEGEVVFAGYGLTVPGKMGEGYDSYSGLDVTNKIVMVLRYVPEAVEPKRRQELNRYAGLRYKSLIARTQGARAILVVSGPNSPNAGALAPLTFETSLSGSGIVAASITDRVAEAILAGAGKDLKTLQTALDSENPHAAGGFLVPNVRLRIGTAVERLKATDRNVIGFLPPSSSAQGGGRQREYILLGAHYDHLGRGETSGFARKEEEGWIHPGADDNASGVAALLELARSMAYERRQQPDLFQRGVIFAFWAGEEIGLIGSSHFAEAPPMPLENIAAYLNFDMVGRLRENRLYLQGIGSSSDWTRSIEKRNVPAGFNLVLQEDPFLPTDTTTFYPKGIPVLAFFTGSHEEYHRPADRPETLNYEGIERIARFARGITLDLLQADERPAYVKVERPGGPRGMREGLRAYLGTIPDYATEDVKGVKVAGVRSGSPADDAGLEAGDLIVELAGQEILNIYDYTYALDAARIGEETKIVIIRDGQRLALPITPRARN